MTDFESTLRATAAAWSTDARPDWEDVLRRAGRHRPSAVGARRAALAAGVGIVAVVLTVPALGVGTRLKDLVTGTRGPGLTFAADLRHPGGSSAGTFSLRTSRLFVTTGRPKRAFPYMFVRRKLHGIELAWQLDLRGSEQATSVRIVRGRHVVAVVCRPCSGREAGKVRLKRGAIDLLLRGRTSASVSTSHGAAVGPIRFEPPPR